MFNHHMKSLGYKYKNVHTRLPSYHNKENKRIFYITELLCNITNESNAVLFFDSTCIVENNFVKKGWTIINKSPLFDKKFVYNKTHCLMLIDNQKVVATQFFKGAVKSIDIVSFFYEALIKSGCRVKFKMMTVILDNTTVHKTKLFLDFFRLHQIRLFFIVKRHSLFNPVEYVFRYIIKDLRKHFSML